MSQFRYTVVNIKENGTLEKVPQLRKEHPHQCQGHSALRTELDGQRFISMFGNFPYYSGIYYTSGFASTGNEASTLGTTCQNESLNLT